MTSIFCLSLRSEFNLFCAKNSTYDCKFLGCQPKLLMTALEPFKEMHKVDQLGFEATINPIVQQQDDDINKQPATYLLIEKIP